MDLLEFVMADGAVRNGGHHSETGQPQPTFDLEPDEHIVRLETKQQDANLFGLRIHTSKGRESPWYGGQDGATEEFSGSAEDPIVGFERRGDGCCPRIIGIQRLRDTTKTLQSDGGSPSTSAIFNQPDSAPQQSEAQRISTVKNPHFS